MRIRQSVYRWRKRLVAAVLYSFDVISMVLALLPLNYKPATAATATTRLIQVAAAGSEQDGGSAAGGRQFAISIFYGIGLYLGIGGVLFYTMQTNADIMDIDYFEEKPLSAAMTTAHALYSMCVLAIILLRNWLGRVQYLALLADIRQVEYDYFRHTHALQQCHAYDIFIIIAAIVRSIQTLSSLYIFISLSRGVGLGYILVALTVLFLSNATYSLQFQFCFAVLQLYRYAWTLNRQLLGMPGGSQPCGRLADELARISSCFMRLYALGLRLMAAFDLQMLLIITLYVAANSVHLFNFIVAWSGKIHALDLMSLLVFMQVVCINCMDFWYIISVCEYSLQETRSTSVALRDLHYALAPTLQSGESLERTMESFVMWRCCHAVRFRLCGFFDLHHRTGHQALVTTITFFILLIQYDYANL